MKLNAVLQLVAYCLLVASALPPRLHMFRKRLSPVRQQANPAATAAPRSSVQ